MRMSEKVGIARSELTNNEISAHLTEIGTKSML